MRTIICLAITAVAILSTSATADCPHGRSKQKQNQLRDLSPSASDLHAWALKLSGRTGSLTQASIQNALANYNAGKGDPPPTPNGSSATGGSGTVSAGFVNSKGGTTLEFNGTYGNQVSPTMTYFPSTLYFTVQHGSPMVNSLNFQVSNYSKTEKNGWNCSPVTLSFYGDLGKGGGSRTDLSAFNCSKNLDLALDHGDGKKFGVFFNPQATAGGEFLHYESDGSNHFGPAVDLSATAGFHVLLRGGGTMVVSFSQEESEVLDRFHLVSEQSSTFKITFKSPNGLTKYSCMKDTQHYAYTSATKDYTCRITQSVGN